MTRRCSHCSNNGHNSRTCPARAGGGVRLFGVRISEGGGAGVGGIMKKSASMGCLSQYASLGASARASSSLDVVAVDAPAEEGYASDDPDHASCSVNRRGERKRGTPWTEEEHRMFLVGLHRLGKGDWRGIARNYVVSRTPTQVASHAQKYFIRQSNTTKRKRRSSLFDMPSDLTPGSFMHRSASEPNFTNLLPSLDLTMELEPASTDHAFDVSAHEPNDGVQNADLPPMVPTFYPAYFPVPYPFWPSVPPPPVEEDDVAREAHEVLKPTPVLAKNFSHVEELTGLSKLSIGDSAANRIEPSALSSKLLGPSSSRQSAFHVNPAVPPLDLSLKNGSAIHAV